jgi:hypothetical protein
MLDFIELDTLPMLVELDHFGPNMVMCSMCGLPMNVLANERCLTNSISSNDDEG